jgi:hypothetical protein
VPADGSTGHRVHLNGLPHPRPSRHESGKEAGRS